MSLRIRRGTNAQRTGITFDLGEIVYTTDTQKLYIGDGVTAGGKNLLETSAGNGFTFNQATQQIDFAIGNLNLNTSQVTEDASRLYYTDERAQDAVAAALVAGNAFNTGVTFTYNDALNRITAVSTGGLTNISADTNPSLGGNLSTGSFNISGNGSISAGTISATTGLGANLPLNGKTINGTGNISIGGTISNGTLTLDTNVIRSTVVAPSVPGYQVNNIVKIGDTVNPNSLSITSTASFGVMTGLTNGTETSGLITKISRGTLASPTTVAAGDGISLSSAFGYDGSTFVNAGGFGIAVDPGGVISSGNVPGTFAVYTMKSGIPSFLTFNSNGILDTPNLSTTGLRYYTPNYVTVSTTTTYSLSATQSYNLLLVTAGSLTATINMPASPTDGQVTNISVLTNTVTLAVGTGTVSPSFAGSATAGTCYRYIYRATGTTWYRI